MPEVTIYTTRFCGFCMRAKQLLSSKGVAFTEFAVDGDHEQRSKLLERTGSHTVPQIWVGETYVGGCDELYALERSKKLDTMLTNQD